MSGLRLKFKELKRVLAVALAVSCVAPNTVYAAEAVGIEQQMHENGWYYDESGTLRNADGVAIDENGNPIEQVVEETQTVTETPTPDVVPPDTETTPTPEETPAPEESTTETPVDESQDTTGGTQTPEGGEQGTENSGDAETPEQGDEQKPAEGDDEQKPEQGEDEQKPEEGEDQKPEQGGDDQKPEEGDDQKPEEGGDVETPENPDDGDEQKPEEGDDQKPEEGEDQKPEEGGDEQKPEEGGDVQEPEAPVTPEEPEIPAEPEQPAEEPAQEPETPAETPVEEQPAEDPAEEQTNNTVHTGGVGHRVQMPVVSTIKDFRFYTIEKEYAFAKEDLNILEDTKDDARVIGTLVKDGMCFVMKDCDDGWTYVESGDVRGFVRSEKLYLNEEAQGVVDSLKQKAQEQTDKENAEIRKNIEERLKKEMTKNEGETDEAFTERFNKAVEEAFNNEKKPLIDFETLVEKAKEVISWKENKALAYTRATTRTFLADKKFGLVTATALNVREGKGTDTRIVGLLPNNALVYILADEDQEWIYIESGDVRGFVHSSYIKTGEDVDKEVAETGEDNFPEVESKVDFKDVSSLYYVRESIKEGKHSSKIREEIVNYAQQFVGNPYVWGGTDPVNGADCSGFVQSIYADFGYSLPRVSQDQAYYGERIAVEDAQPGDLIFYMDSTGDIYHVVMYAGNGQTVEAMSTARGITNGTVGGNACWATRIISEDDDLQSDAIVRYADSDEYGEYLGNYKLTFYCPCEICCGEWANGITATGTTATEGRTIAVDPTVIPYGTEVIIGDRVYIAEDCGGAIKGNRIDVYVDSHEKALEMGVQYADVFIKK